MISDKTKLELIKAAPKLSHIALIELVIEECQLAQSVAKEQLTTEQEPVAWGSILGAVARGWCYEENANKTMDTELAVAIAKEVQALYTTPPQRKPLTDEQIWDAYMQISAEFDCNVIDLVEFARAIEAAHGIKE